MLRLLITALALCLGSGAQASEPDTQVYDSFRQYRLALANEEPVLRYFSRDYWEEWLDALLYVDKNDAIHNIGVVKSELDIGRQVKKLHSYEVKDAPDGRQILTLYFSAKGYKQLAKVVLVYRYDSGAYLVDGIESYLMGFGEIPKEVVEQFE